MRVQWKNEEAAKVAVSKYGVCLTQVLGDGKGIFIVFIFLVYLLKIEIILIQRISILSLGYI